MKRIPKRALVSAGVVAVSVLLAIANRLWMPMQCQKTLAYILVGGWALLPPIWFIYEWHSFESEDPTQRAHLKYDQELARNIWIALVVVLAVISGIKWGGE